MVSNTVKLKYECQSKPAHGTDGIAAYPYGLEYGNAQHEAENQVRVVFDELAHGSSSCTGEAEILTTLYHAVNDTKHEVQRQVAGL